MSPAKKLQAECKSVSKHISMHLYSSTNDSTEEPCLIILLFLPLNWIQLVCSILPMCWLLTEGKMCNREHQVTCQRHRCPPDWTRPITGPFALHAYFLTEVQLWQVIKLQEGTANFSQHLSSGDRGLAACHMQSDRVITAWASTALVQWSSLNWMGAVLSCCVGEERWRSARQLKAINPETNCWTFPCAKELSDVFGYESQKVGLVAAASLDSHSAASKKLVWKSVEYLDCQISSQSPGGSNLSSNIRHRCKI